MSYNSDNQNSRISSNKLANFLCGKSDTILRDRIFLTENRAKNLFIKLNWDFDYVNDNVEKILTNEEKFNFEIAQSNKIDFLFEEIFRSTYYFNNSFSHYELDTIRKDTIEYLNQECLINGWKVDLYGKLYKKKASLDNNILVDLGWNCELSEEEFITETLIIIQDIPGLKNKLIIQKINRLRENLCKTTPDDPSTLIAKIKLDLKNIKDANNELWDSIKLKILSSNLLCDQDTLI